MYQCLPPRSVPLVTSYKQSKTLSKATPLQLSTFDRTEILMWIKSFHLHIKTPPLYLQIELRRCLLLKPNGWHHISGRWCPSESKKHQESTHRKMSCVYTGYIGEIHRKSVSVYTGYIGETQKVSVYTQGTQEEHTEKVSCV